MRNVSVTNLRKVIKLRHEDFEKIIDQLFSNEVKIQYDLEDSGWFAYWANYEDKNIEEPSVPLETQIFEKLGKYFDIEIDEIITDNYAPCNFWISYKI